MELAEANAIVNELSLQAQRIVGDRSDGGVAHGKVYAQLLARLPLATQEAIRQAYAAHNAKLRSRHRR